MCTYVCVDVCVCVCLCMCVHVCDVLCGVRKVGEHKQTNANLQERLDEQVRLREEIDHVAKASQARIEGIIWWLGGGGQRR